MSWTGPVFPSLVSSVRIIADGIWPRIEEAERQIEDWKIDAIAGFHSIRKLRAYFGPVLDFYQAYLEGPTKHGRLAR
jgi:hypothetical protein